MSKEIRAIVNTIQTADSMKAVKVALGLSEANQKSIGKVMEVVSLMDNNMKLLASRLELVEEKLKRTIEEISKYERSSN
mgnify:FL=1